MGVVLWGMESVISEGGVVSALECKHTTQGNITCELETSRKYLYK